jgi:hypothetical protein
MGIVAAVIVPRLEPGIAGQLEAAGSIVVSDLDYARQLAVVNQTSYMVDFPTGGAQYTITHSGSNSAYDALPNSPFRHPSDPATQHICRFTDLPQSGTRLQFVAWEASGSAATTGQLIFDPLGSLSSGNDSTIYLAASHGRSSFYLPIVVNATTGLARVGAMTSANPLANEGSSKPASTRP